MKPLTPNAALKQLYALAHAIPQRTDKKAIAKLWFKRAKALLAGKIAESASDVKRLKN